MEATDNRWQHLWKKRRKLLTSGSRSLYPPSPRVSPRFSPSRLLMTVVLVNGSAPENDCAILWWCGVRDMLAFVTWDACVTSPRSSGRRDLAGGASRLSLDAGERRLLFM